LVLAVHDLCISRTSPELLAYFDVRVRIAHPRRLMRGMCVYLPTIIYGLQLAAACGKFLSAESI